MRFHGSKGWQGLQQLEPALAAAASTPVRFPLRARPSAPAALVEIVLRASALLLLGLALALVGDVFGFGQIESESR